MDKIGNDEVSVVRKIHLPSGARVDIGDIILEVETSKTILDIRAESSGLLLHNLEDDSRVKQGQTLFEIRVEGDVAKVVDAPSFFTGNKILPNSEVRPISMRKQSEINNLLSIDHGSSSSVLTILVDMPGERILSTPFIFKDGISDILVFEAAKLLIKYKELNAYYQGDGMVEFYSQVNFGWSFDNRNNLKVLTIRSAELLSLTELQNTVFDLLKSYEVDEKLPVNLVVGSTVTFTDLSRTETESLIPLINGKQSLILGLTRPSKNQFRVIASYDHRVSAGLTVANFLSELKERVLSYFYVEDGLPKLNCVACQKSMKEELDLGYRGFIRITLSDGNTANLCRNCFEGW
jgi:pyruvate/2-oxoglutarate dehydrogenase complex dihydrolipoamide acyltransferase (E2) component